MTVSKDSQVSDDAPLWFHRGNMVKPDSEATRVRTATKARTKISMEAPAWFFGSNHQTAAAALDPLRCVQKTAVSGIAGSDTSVSGDAPEWFRLHHIRRAPTPPRFKKNKQPNRQSLPSAEDRTF